MQDASYLERIQVESLWRWPLLFAMNYVFFSANDRQKQNYIVK